MKIFSSSSKSHSNKTPTRINVRPWLYAGGIVAALGLIGFAFVVGVLSFPSMKVAFNPIAITTKLNWQNKAAVYEAVLKAMKDAPGNYIRAHLRTDKPPKLHIDINFKNFEKIRAKREEALRRGYLDADPSDFVPARIKVDGRSVKVKLRLKGDLLDHIRTKQWSFRIKVRDNDQIFGLRRFSIHAPFTRESHREPLFLDHLRREGILAPSYQFVNIILNGDDLGVMAVEEHFSKELLESQRRQEGVIVKFDGNDWWRFKIRYVTAGPYADFDVPNIIPFRSQRVGKSKKLQSDYMVAVGLLRGYIDGRLPALDVFDARTLPRYLALLSLWGAYHPLALDNIRLYLNPITMRLEPVGFDGQPLLNHYPVIMASPPFKLFKAAFSDPAFAEAYVAESRRIGKDVQSEAFGRWFDEREKRYIETLHRDNPLVPGGVGKILRERAKVLAKLNLRTLSRQGSTSQKPNTPDGYDYPRLINAYIYDDDANRSLEIRNIIPEQVLIERISLGGSAKSAFLSLNNERIELPLVLPPRERGQPSPTLRIQIKSKARFDPRSVVIDVSRKGLQTVQEHAILYSKPRKMPVLQKISFHELIKMHPFIQWDKENKLALIPKGDWQIKTNLILPTGSGLTIEAGVSLTMYPNTFIIVRGPLKLMGGVHDPVVLDSAAANAPWGGIAVLESPEPSLLRHSALRNMKTVQDGPWAMSGAVSFYRSEVTVEDSTFEKISAEDGINIINSKFQIQRSTIADTSSDAIDADFSNGLISNSKFRNIGGDGIDASGSKIDVNNVRLENIHDKAISVGEVSHMKASNIIVIDASTGVASKDGSLTEIKGAKFETIRNAALMGYQKKPEYGPGRLIATEIEFKQVNQQAIVQKGSALTLNERIINPIDLDVDVLYKNQYMRKETN